MDLKDLPIEIEKIINNYIIEINTSIKHDKIINEINNLNLFRYEIIEPFTRAKCFKYNIIKNDGNELLKHDLFLYDTIKINSYGSRIQLKKNYYSENGNIYRVIRPTEFIYLSDENIKKIFEYLKKNKLL